jgi:hypothetical protein
MPGWYVHMDAARQTAERLRAGEVPPELGLDPADATALGEICHTWRNYLALGALGPDLFYMLPDFKNTTGCVIRQVVQWALDVWDVIDSEFISKWENWVGPISTNEQQLASQLTAGLAAQFGQILDELSSALRTAFEGLLATMGDWFGVLTSGPPQGFGDDAFYWSDIFHYRRTYQFAFVLFEQARQAQNAATTDEERKDAETRLAFAVGWMTHCGTDVTGHAFTNSKAGGPYRDHWQRHHLVENHFDSQNYNATHPGPLYGEYGTSALHFWVSFRHRDDAPYDGRDDAPAYDYFGPFPAYDDSDTPTAAASRKTFFDLDTGKLPTHLVDGVLDAMAAVHPDGPKILTQQPSYSANDVGGNPDGRPNDAAMQEMWSIVYAYMKMSGRDGLAPRKPQPPDVFTDHSFPTPPGFGGADDDPSRGADVDSDDSFTLLDLLLAIFAWIVYLAEVAVWLATILPSLIADPLTFPAREAVYWAFVQPAWDLYMLSRRALVMSGFLIPKPEEVALGLTVLGTDGSFDVGAALDDPFGAGGLGFFLDEPSGRLTSTSQASLDPAYPRNVVRDDPSAISRPDLTGALGLTGTMRYAGDGTAELKPSEWIAPWRYPLLNQAGQGVPQEGGETVVGPYTVGTASTVLLSALAGDKAARAALEKAATPDQTLQATHAMLALDKHLGGPVDYSTYLVGCILRDRGKVELGVPDFNLDSDRGYAWKCWDWDRHNLGRDPQQPALAGEWECVPDFTATAQSSFVYAQPCTPPQQFHADHDNPRRFSGGIPLDSQWYDPHLDVKVHYRNDRSVPPAPEPFGTDPCGRSKPVRHDLVLGLDWRKLIDQDGWGGGDR